MTMYDVETVRIPRTACLKRSFRLVWSGAADPRGCRKATIHYRTGMDRVDRACGDSEAQHEESEVLGRFGKLGDVCSHGNLSWKDSTDQRDTKRI